MLKLSTLALAATSAFAAGLPKQYLSMTCDGALEMFPGHEMGMAIDIGSILSKFSDAFEFTSRADFKKACPTITDDQIEMVGGIFFVESYLLQTTDAGRGQLEAALDAVRSACDGGDFSLTGGLLTPLLYKIINFPTDTCNHAGYKEGKPCSLAWELQEQGIELHLQFQKCDAHRAPSVVLSCTGDACDHVLKPCSSNADCAGAGGLYNQCTEVFSLTDAAEGLEQLFEDGKMYIKEKDAATCAQDRPFGNKVMDAAIKHGMAALGYDGQSPILGTNARLGFCNFPAVFKTWIKSVQQPQHCSNQNSQQECGELSYCQWIPNYCKEVSSSRNAGTDLMATLPVTVNDLTTGSVIDFSGLRAAPPVTQIKSSLAGYVPGADGGITLLKFDCSGNLQILQQDTLVQGRIKGSLAIKVLDVVMKTLLDVMPCRATMPQTGIVDVLTSYFAPWSVKFWAGLFLGQDYSGVESNFRTFFEANIRGNIKMVGAPATCNAKSLLAGKCNVEVDVTDFLTALGLKWSGVTKAKLQVEPCAASPYGFQMMLTCLGPGCDFLKKRIPQGTCDPTSATACGEGYRCVDLSVGIGYPGIRDNNLCECKNEYDWCERADWCEVEEGRCSDEEIMDGVLVSKAACNNYGRRSMPSTMLANFARRLVGSQPFQDSGAICMPRILSNQDQADKMQTWADNTMKVNRVLSTGDMIFEMGSNIQAAMSAPIPNSPADSPAPSGDTEISSASVVRIDAWLFAMAVTVPFLAHSLV